MNRKHLIVAVCALALTGASTITCTAANAEGYNQLAGTNRYETSVAISRHAYPTSAENVYLARGDVLADALSAGSLPGGPIVLVNPVGSNAAAAQYVSALKVSGKVIALGGPGVVSDTTLTQVAGDKPTSRIFGANRYETSAKVAAAAFPSGAKVAYIANGAGDGSPDAVAGGVLTDGPVILVNPNGNNAFAANAIKALGAQKVIALGGPGAVSAAVLSEVSQGIATDRLQGENRYVTSLAIANHAFPGHKGTFYVARGDVLADSVSGGALQDGPIILSPTSSNSGINIASGYVHNNAASPIFLGGSIWNPQVMQMIASGTGYTQPAQPAQPAQPTQPAQPAQPAQPSNPGNAAASMEQAAAQEEADIYAGINARRAQDGIAPLTRDPAMDAMARAWSQHMAQTGDFEHSDGAPNGIDSILGNPCHMVGENIDWHMGYFPAGQGGAKHVTNWIHSPGHFANLINSGFTTTGIGVWFDGPNSSYATQMFCR
ncbi:cell wall-binding repeat-containing protein [uncultured Mobiluncus sp.]|uniref:cell wall-binding repeat-containing protein n=1 Tax=uncultured Mobiluncus sp. TaxID=293425 RepID=UPI002889A5BA|nr:cell wall-binding repeat-containing protein [uncultured Mobiluncus sp.]